MLPRFYPIVAFNFVNNFVDYYIQLFLNIMTMVIHADTPVNPVTRIR